MGSKNKSVTVGYWYRMVIHGVVCHGPVDAVQALYVGEREAWTGNTTSNADIVIDKPDLFGGESREGGVAGIMQVLMGGDSQPVNDLIAAERGDAPAYRGLLSLVFRSRDARPKHNTWPRQFIYSVGNSGFTWCAMNPYIKPFWVKVKHIVTGRSWYTAKAAIGNDMNPAHILYDVLTNTKYALGFSSLKINDASFRAVADKLHAEGFGLSIIWQGSTKAWDFIEQILDHINAMLYVDPATGEFTLKLVRDDYDVDDLLVLDESNISAFNDFERAAWGEITNQVTVAYTNPETEKEASVTVQNEAAVAAQGGRTISTEVSLPGVRSASLALRCAARELRALSAPLAKVNLEVNRVGYALRPGDVVKLNWSALGLFGMAMRVTEIEYGTSTDTRIRLSLVEDVFGMPSTVYAQSQPGGWVDPVVLPVAITQQRVMEASYYEVVRAQAPSILADLDPAFGFGKLLAARPNSAMMAFDIAVNTSGVYQTIAAGQFNPSAQLAGDIDKTVTEFSLAALVDIEEVPVGALCYLEDEALEYLGFNESNGKYVFKRGVIDTVPAEHAVGALIYFDAEGTSVDETERLNGETVQYKLLTKNGLGILSDSFASALTLTLARRYQRPYPPGNVRLNGNAYPPELEDTVAATWSHRDRTQQTAGYVAQSAGNIGPEAGTTYSWRLLRLDTNAVLESGSGVTGTTVTLTSTYRGNVRFELWSVRDGLESYQRQRVDFYWITATRTTETGGTRITESGDTRNLEA